MRVRAVLLVAAFALAPDRAAGQLRVVTYNVGQGPRTGTDTVLQAIGTESRNGIARPLDVLLIQESSSAASTGQSFVTLLNTLYGANTYARGTVNGGGPTTQSIIYRTAAVQLVAETVIDTTLADNSAGARDTMRFQLRPAGYAAAADFYVYSSHYKASTGTDSGASFSNATRRNNEATLVRANADALGANARVVYAGDLNMYTRTEAAYSTLTVTTGNARAVDPVAASFSSGDWTGTANRGLHTQSPVVNNDQNYSGQVGGGMDDRFDFQLVSTAMNSGRGVSLIGGSYRAFGNNGTHTYNSNITTGTGASAAVLTALSQSSDHIPVVADYQIPARLAASVTAPARVIRGTTANLTLSVTNTAPVATANGADVLDYTFAGTGAVAGSGSRTGLAALAAAQTNALTVPTTTAGTYTGNATATGTSPGVANGSFSQAVSVLALDPANGSFAAASDVNDTAADFGTAVAGQVVTRRFTVFNLASASGVALTARLRLVGTTEAVPGGPFTVAFDPFTGDLNAGSDRGLTVTFDSAAPGTFTDTFTFQFADEDIPGATGQTLTIGVTGTFTPVPEPAGLLVVAALVLARRKMRA